jgi:small subunit ribosomal protein S3
LYDKKRQNFDAGISKIVIRRTAERVKITIHTAKPGIIIGKGGKDIEVLTAQLQKLVSGNKVVKVDIVEIKRQELDAQLVSEDIAKQLENRVTFRRAMKQAMGRTMKAGAKGIKTAVSGRLGGADMARREHYHEGTIPLQTLRADIDYGFAEADTTYGKIGVKVWIYKGEILPEKPKKKEADRDVDA